MVSKIEQDHQRFRQIVRGKIRKELRQVRRQLDSEIESPSVLRFDVPAALDAVVMRGLSRNPAQRFQTALEMRAAPGRLVTSSLEETMQVARFMLCDRTPAAFSRAVAPFLKLET